MNDTLLYKSKRTAKSLWQAYRIYRDRLELQWWLLFHTVVVPADEIRAIEVRPALFTGPGGAVWGIKLDFCNSCRHVLLIRKSGLFKRIGFAPDDRTNLSKFANPSCRMGEAPPVITSHQMI
ncbi:MAG: hypothetical protein ABSC01_08970 [Verrucomicrobiota bacterium]|jgi:hypothetical protein